MLEAAEGAEALDLYRQHENQIHLIITDVVMPRMSGRELVEQLQLQSSAAAAARVLYMSGYTDDAIVHHGVLHEDANFIEKPFTPDALTTRVREILDR
ncbi:MAG: response regulator [Pyrinomonadaceae bacterium]